MRLELFAILIGATLLSLLAGYKSKLSPLVAIAGIFCLVMSASLYSQGLEVEAGTHKYLPAGIDANIVDYNITYTALTTTNDFNVLFLFWIFFIIGIFLVLYGLYLSF